MNERERVIDREIKRVSETLHSKCKVLHDEAKATVEVLMEERNKITGLFTAVPDSVYLGRVKSILDTCDQPGCERPSAYWFNWLEEPQKGVCSLHTSALVNVARSLGVHLPLTTVPTVPPVLGVTFCHWSECAGLATYIASYGVDVDRPLCAAHHETLKKCAASFGQPFIWEVLLRDAE